MSVGDEYEGETVIDSKLAVIDSMNEPDEAGRVPEESIARTVIPYNRDDDKARYLGLRACAFTTREAARLLQISMSTISTWRKDEEFKSLEARLPEFRQQLAEEYANLEFLRNYRLIMEKDFQIIQKSLGIDKANGATTDKLEAPEMMSQQDFAYLTKIRQFYSPQQFQIMKSIASGKSGGEGTEEFNFTQTVLELSKMTARLEISGK